MSRAGQRVQLARAYVLHQRPFRDSSLILEVFARDHGHFSVFVHAARRARSRFAALQPFRPLLLSWSGRGEAPQLTGAEYAGPQAAQLPAPRLMSAFYLNELLLKLLTRHDPSPELFDQYERTLHRLCAEAEAEAPLRHFEARLLDLIGYGLNLDAEADTGRAVRPEAYYHFEPGVHGFVIAEPGSSRAIAGEVLQRLSSGSGFAGDGDLQQARILMRAALDHCLEGRQLSTRLVARELNTYTRKERSG
jgi:DNA repair protein RecO (recombination protein O)